MLVRIRLPEVLEEHIPPMTAYEVAKRSGGRIIPSTLYRLVRQGGKVKFFDSDLLDALCDVLDVGPSELLAREKERKRRR